MAAKWLKTRQTKYTAYAGVYTLVILGVLGAVSFLANRYAKSLDTTANKQFSLSDQTIKVVRNLKRDINIKYFDEANRFPQARDLLDRYSSLSPKVRVEFIDPVKKPQQAKAAGFRRDVNILVDSGLRKEEAKSLSEEEVTGALIRSLKSGERNACFVSGSGEHSITDTGRGGYAAVKDALERNNYKTKTVSLLSAAPATPETPAPAVTPAPAAPAAIPGQAPGKIQVPADCTVLIVAGPQHDYIQPEADAIKTFVENGGKAL